MLDVKQVVSANIERDVKVDDRYKLAVVLRTDLGMGKGKLVTKGVQAAIWVAEVTRNIDKKLYDAWFDGGMLTITLKVENEEKMLQIQDTASIAGIPSSRMVDAGRTQLEPRTWTSIAIGPWYAEEIDKVTVGLKLL